MTTAIIIQARTASTRLPGKVLAPVLGRPLLAYQIERLKRSRLADVVVVATTKNPADADIARLALQTPWWDDSCDVYLGSEHDVLSRYIGAARMVGADTIIRSTADCPLIDPAYIDLLIAQFNASGAEYGWLGDHPGGIPNGMGAEAVRLETLERIYPHTTAEEREHVTLHIRRRPSEFRMMSVETGLGLDDERWTVDTAADLELVRRIIEAFTKARAASYGDPRADGGPVGDAATPYTGFTLADVHRLLIAHPEWRAINADVPMGVIDRENLARFARDFAPWKGDL